MLSAVDGSSSINKIRMLNSVGLMPVLDTSLTDNRKQNLTDAGQVAQNFILKLHALG